MFPFKDELLQSGPTMEIPFVSYTSAAYCAEQCPATIVKFMDAQCKGDPMHATGELHVTLTILYLNNIPMRISDPDANVPHRASEAYFAVWAKTQYGSAAVNNLYSKLPGLRYRSTFADGEIQDFVRELLTKNTDLNNNTSALGTMTCWAKGMLVIAFLASVDRRLTIEGALEGVKHIFWLGRDLPANVTQEICDILEEADTVFDSDFGVERYLPDGTREFFLPSGYENKILAHRYRLETFAYFKMPDYNPKHGECSPLMEKLPMELMSIVAQKLLVFKEPIKVIRKLRRANGKPEYCFKICEPSHMRNAAAFPFNTRLRPGWIISNPGRFFALAKTNRKNYHLVREVFFKHNKILLHRSYTGRGYSFGSHEIKPWLEAIGREARRSLGNLSIELHLRTRNQNGLDRDAVHAMIKLIGQSHSLRSLVIKSVFWNERVPNSMTKIRNWLQPLTYFRGLTVFQVGNYAEMEAYIRAFATRPKELQHHEQQPAFMPDNRNSADLTPLREKTLRSYHTEELRLLFIHNRTRLDQINAVSVARVAEEVSRKKAIASAMSKAELVKALLENNATWKRIAAAQRKDRAVLRKMDRLLASDAAYSVLSGRRAANEG